MGEKVAVQIKDQAFNRKDSISVINFSSEFKRTRNLSRIQDGAAAYIHRESMNCFDLTAIKAWLTLSWNDANKHDGSITTY